MAMRNEEPAGHDSAYEEPGQQTAFRLPGVGLRIVRSVSAAFLCFMIYLLRGEEGFPFLSALAALQCIKPYLESSRSMVKRHAAGTVVGAIWGLLTLVLITAGPDLLRGAKAPAGYLIVAAAMGGVLYSTAVLRLKDVASFSCMVFLSITMLTFKEVSPILLVCRRVADVIIGVLAAGIVNTAHLPRRKNQNVLFVSGVDEALLTKSQELTSYSRVELNRLIDDGAMFTLSTLRTPASLLESVGDLHLKLPVIVMDGAALYDINENSYLLTYMMSFDQSKRIMDFLDDRNLNSFVNVVMDDLLVIYYGKLTNAAESDIYKTLRKSPHRNYVNRQLPEDETVVYFMVIDETKKIAEAYDALMKQNWISEHKVLTYTSREYPGYAYIKIYNKDATRENMLRNLKAMLDMEKSLTFGSIPGQCDVLIENSDHNMMVKKLRRSYEPISLRQK